MFRSDCLFYICKLIINMLNTTDGVEVHLDITKVYRLSLVVRRIAQIFLKPIVEKLVVFRAKMWAQMGKRVVSWETRSYFFFGTVFSETRPIKMAVFTCYLGIKAWNTEVVFIETRGFCCGGIHWNQGILASPKPLVSMKPPQQNPGFNETTPGFKLLTQKHAKPPIFVGRVSLKPSQKKKKSGFLIKTVNRVNFLVHNSAFGRHW